MACCAHLFSAEWWADWAAEPSVDHLRKLMRRVYTQQDEARARGAAARERMAARFSNDALAARLQRRGGPAALIAARWAAEDGRLLSDSPGREHARADDGAHALRRSV